MWLEHNFIGKAGLLQDITEDIKSSEYLKELLGWADLVAFDTAKELLVVDTRAAASK